MKTTGEETKGSMMKERRVSNSYNHSSQEIPSVLIRKVERCGEFVTAEWHVECRAWTLEEALVGVEAGAQILKSGEHREL